MNGSWTIAPDYNVMDDWRRVPAVEFSNFSKSRSRKSRREAQLCHSFFLRCVRILIQSVRGGRRRLCRNRRERARAQHRRRGSIHDRIRHAVFPPERRSRCRGSRRGPACPVYVASAGACVDCASRIIHKWSSSAGGGAHSVAGGTGGGGAQLGGESARYVARYSTRVRRGGASRPYERLQFHCKYVCTRVLQICCSRWACI